MPELLIDVLGWLGTFLIVSAYGLLSMGRLTGSSLIYQGMNLLGAFLLGANAAYYKAYPSVGINVIWILIGAVTLPRLLRGRRSPPTGP